MRGPALISSIFKERTIECEKHTFESLRKDNIKKKSGCRRKKIIIVNTQGLYRADRVYSQMLQGAHAASVNICETSHHSFLFLQPNSVVAVQKQTEREGGLKQCWAFFSVSIPKGCVKGI